jgi:hypothetical protein
MAVDPVPADPALNALLVATATEDWPAWYGCTRLAVADYLEDRNFPGDRQGASLVRQARPTAWAQCPVRPGWEVAEVRLLRDAPAASPTPWVRALVDGHGRGDDGFSRLAEHDLWPGVGRTLSGAYLRPFPLAALRLSAVIPDESGVCAVVSLRPAFNPHDHPRREDLQVTSWDARLWCRREVMALFPAVLVKAPCPHCGGKGTVVRPGAFVDEVAGAGVLRLNHSARAVPKLAPCPVCRGRPPRPCPAPSLLPALPAVALPALAPLN